MADLTKMAASEVAEEHRTEAHAPYLKVWFALAILTAIEYYYAFIFKNLFLILLIGLLVWAIVKAGLVGWFFMHLKFEGNWVYILIVPAFVLATILVLALLPDMALKENADDNQPQDSSFVVPASGGPGSDLRTALENARSGISGRPVFPHAGFRATACERPAALVPHSGRSFQNHAS